MVDYRFVDGALVTPGYAWTGFIAALLAGSNPLYIIGTGLFLSALKVGAAGLQRNTRVPLQLVDVVQAAIIFMIAMRPPRPSDRSTLTADYTDITWTLFSM